jgi:hypothetical protein
MSLIIKFHLEKSKKLVLMAKQATDLSIRLNGMLESSSTSVLFPDKVLASKEMAWSAKTRNEAEETNKSKLQAKSDRGH